MHLSIAIRAALEAGKAILEVYNTDFAVEHKEDKTPLTLADKNANAVIEDHLSDTDLPILSEEGRSISYEERGKWKQLWVVDPLDGPREFIKRNGEFTVNIGLIEDGKTIAGVIYQPTTDTLYYGDMERGAFKLNNASIVAEPFKRSFKMTNELPKVFTVVASRSHLSPETAEYVNKLKVEHGEINFISSGSSLKLCLLAEGKAHMYPRFSPTMEWDTAAGHAILKAAGKNVYSQSTGEELEYNKENLLNDWFIAK